MKRIVFLSVMISAVMATFASEEKPVTPALQRSFDRKFGKVENVKWKQASDGYSASFVKDNMSWHAGYDKNGKWSHTIRIIFHNQLPLRVLQAIEKQYSTEEVLSIYEYQLAEGSDFYLVHAVTKKKDEYVKYYIDGAFETIEK